MMISNRNKPFGPHGLYEIISTLLELRPISLPNSVLFGGETKKLKVAM